MKLFSLSIHSVRRIAFRLVLPGVFVALALPALLSGIAAPQPAVLASAPPALSARDSTTGLGAGAITTAAIRSHTTTTAALPQDCSIFSNPTCWVQQAITTIAQWLAGGILNFLQNVASSVHINAGADDFITQTPLCVSNLFGCDPSPPINQTLLTFIGWGQAVVGAALTLIIVIGGFNLMLGRQMGTRVHDFSELFPRVILTFLAALVSPIIMQAFITLNNALCTGVMTLFALTALTNILVNLLSTGFGEGWMIFLFILVLGVMFLLLIGQMLARLAFAAFLCALGPLGLLCFALPQTLSWGRLWLRQFSLTIFVQFVQVALLGLGGMLLSDLVKLATPLFGGLAHASTFLEAMVAVALLWLTLRLPGMLREWAMRGTADQAGHAVTDALAYGASVAPELLALL